MKKHIAGNTKLSVGALFVILVFDVFSQNNSLTYYYFTVLYFFTIYIIQALFLSVFSSTPTKFHIIYSVTTMFKMFFSLALLALYYFFTEETFDPRQSFSFPLFFTTTYFIYLMVNTKSFFINTK